MVTLSQTVTTNCYPWASEIIPNAFFMNADMPRGNPATIINF